MTPAGIGVLHPLLGEVIVLIEMVVVLTILGTALFGSPALSERAFRLLRWFRNRPEPQAPTPGDVRKQSRPDQHRRRPRRSAGQKQKGQ